MLLLNPKGGFSQSDLPAFPVEQSEVTEDNPEQQQREMHFVISNELKNSSCLTPRTLQLNTASVFHRLSKIHFKQINLLRLKEYNSQRRLWEYVSSCQTINYSSLLAALGYHVYALRKIII